MSSSTRIGILIATVAALAVAFVVLSPGDDGTSGTASTTTPATSTTQPTTTAPAPAKPAAVFTTIRVQDGKPVDGVKTIRVTEGERARIEVSSPDTTDEIHVHGYDLTRDLKAGGRVRFSFEAAAEGIFEIELEGTGVQIGKLVVEP